MEQINELALQLTGLSIGNVGLVLLGLLVVLGGLAAAFEVLPYDRAEARQRKADAERLSGR